MPAYRVQVTNTCAENWSNMRPNGNGKFCVSCSKNVIDFTGMKDQEIVEYLLTHKNTCGRFFENQLEKKIIYSPTKAPKHYWPSLSALLVAGLFSVVPAFSQTPVQKKVYKTDTRAKSFPTTSQLKPDPQQNERKDPVKPELTTISGVVFSEQDSLPVAYARVSIEVDSIEIASVQTDSSGHFSLSDILPEVNTTGILYVKAVGYNNHTQILNKESINNPLKIMLKEMATLMGISIITIERKIEITPNPGGYFFNAPGFN